MRKSITILAIIVLGLAGANLAESMSTAGLQIIHNAADPGLREVDIYVNGGLLLDNFAFREATEFLDVPAGVPLTVELAPSYSSSSAEALDSYTVTLDEGVNYVAFASGVLKPGLFAPNPEGRKSSNNLYIKDRMKQKQRQPGNYDFVVFHGSTDAPAVDVVARGVGAIVKGAAYQDITDYIRVPVGSYVLDITPAGDNETVVASYAANLSALKYQVGVIFASGFLNPSANRNGEAFGLFVAYPNGTVIELPAAEKPQPQPARLQVIHNAADPAAAAVDIYVNDALLLDNFAFRAATPFIDVPSNTELRIGVAPGASTSSAQALATFPVTLEPGKTYVVMASGVLNPTEFAANPGGKNTGFTLYVNAAGRESASAGEVMLSAFHGATDAPTVDVRVVGLVDPLVSALAFGDFTGYLAVVPASYTLQFTPAGVPGTVVASYTADLSGLGGGAAVVFASGFLAPDQNKNGAAFGFYAALPNGTVIALPAPTLRRSAAALTGIEDGIARVEGFSLQQNYPNPFNPVTRISFNLPASEVVQMQVFDVSGRQVSSMQMGELSAGAHSFSFDASGLPSGRYFYRIQAGAYSATKSMVLMK